MDGDTSKGQEVEQTEKTGSETENSSTENNNIEDVSAEHDSIESAGEEHERKQIFPHKKIWVRVCLFLVVFIVVVVSAFFVIRANSEKRLKSEARKNSAANTTETETKKAYDLEYEGKKYAYKEDIINILCLGIDKELEMNQARETGSMGLADAIFILSIDTKENRMRVIAIPRDTIVPIKILDTDGNNMGTEKKQITLQFAYGKTAEESGKLMVDTVSQVMYKLPIQRYCAINFQALPVMNDAIGGVEVTVLEDMTWWRAEFTEGNTLLLKGDVALDYVRQRNEYVQASSMSRIERQKQYLMAFAAKAKEAVKQDLTIPVTLFQSIQSNMTTDVKLDEITYLSTELLETNFSSEDVFMVPGDVVMGAEYEEYHVNEEALKKIIVEVFYEEVKEEVEE